jgi:hypothetical protein
MMSSTSSVIRTLPAVRRVPACLLDVAEGIRDGRQTRTM